MKVIGVMITQMKDCGHQMKKTQKQKESNVYMKTLVLTWVCSYYFFISSITGVGKNFYKKKSFFFSSIDIDLVRLGILFSNR